VAEQHVGAEPSGCDSDAKIDLWQQAAILAPGTLLASSRSVMREIVVQRKMSRWPADPAVGVHERRSLERRGHLYYRRLGKRPNEATGGQGLVICLCPYARLAIPGASADYSDILKVLKPGNKAR